MNVSLQNIDKVSAELTVKLEKADYQEKVDKELKSLRQKAQIPGFRKGMVPTSLIKKMYGKSVIAEVVNKALQEAVYNYIKENKVNMLGEPLPNEEKQQNIDFDTMEEFDFVFDIALAPEFKAEVSAKDKVDYYKTQYIQNEDGGITITNTYINPTAVDVQLVAKKNLLGGKALSAGMYQFDLLDSNNEVIETQTNDDQGNIYFNTLNFNQEGHYVYYIQEHINDNDPFVEYDQSIYQVNVDVSRKGNNLQAEVEYLLDDKQVDDLTFNNIYHPLSLTVQKRSKDLSKDPLEGAVYGLYKVNEKGTDILVEKQMSNSEGYMTFTKAIPGYQYYFKEISAPNGHTVDEYKTRTFTIKWIHHKNGKISYQLIYDNQKEDLEEEKQEDSLNLYAQQSIALLENEDTSVNLEAIGVADEVTKLNVTKVDNQGNYLTGAHLQILEKETGKVICDWVSTADTFSTLRELNVNTIYILREVEAPTGYVKANDTEFKLNDYGIVTKISGDAQLVDDQSFNLYNSKQVKEKIVYKTNVTTVKTGDNTNIVIYVILLFVSLLCIFGFLKKKQIKE